MRKAATRQDLELFYPVMRELRPHICYSQFIELYDAAHAADGYELIGVEEDGKLVAAMGYRVLTDYVHGRHLYIDDLVVAESHRSKGLGAQLLRESENIARDLGCSNLRLSTGKENEGGMRFYDREGWTLRSVTYKKTVEPRKIA